jgi:hypothetical protein
MARLHDAATGDAGTLGKLSAVLRHDEGDSEAELS